MQKTQDTMKQYIHHVNNNRYKGCR